MEARTTKEVESVESAKMRKGSHKGLPKDLPEHERRQLFWLRAKETAKSNIRKGNPGPQRFLSSSTDAYKASWVVISSSGSGVYIVKRLDEHGFKYSCDCLSSLNRGICWHMALVAMQSEETELRKVEREKRKEAAIRACRLDPEVLDSNETLIPATTSLVSDTVLGLHTLEQAKQFIHGSKQPEEALRTIHEEAEKLELLSKTLYRAWHESQLGSKSTQN